MRGSPTLPTVSRTRTAMESKPLARSGLSWLTSGPKMLIDGGHAIVRISLTVLVFVGCLTTNVDAMNLEACGKGLNGAQENAWNATNGTSAGPTLQLTYEQCVAQCGGGIGDINWGAFSQSFGAWFLPWIALMFQIPFGAEGKWYIYVSSSFGSPQGTPRSLRGCPQLFCDDRQPVSRCLFVADHSPQHSLA